PPPISRPLRRARPAGRCVRRRKSGELYGSQCAGASNASRVHPSARAVVAAAAGAMRARPIQHVILLLTRRAITGGRRSHGTRAPPTVAGKKPAPQLNSRRYFAILTAIRGDPKFFGRISMIRSYALAAAAGLAALTGIN